MATLDKKIIDDYRYKSGIYIISSLDYQNRFKVGLAGSISDRGVWGSNGVGDRLANLRTGMFDLTVWAIFQYHSELVNEVEKYIHNSLEYTKGYKRLKFPKSDNKSEWFTIPPKYMNLQFFFFFLYLVLLFLSISNGVSI